MKIDKRGKRLILFSVGMSVIFLGIASVIDILIYGRNFSLAFPVIVIIIGIYILYQSLKKLLKK